MTAKAASDWIVARRRDRLEHTADLPVGNVERDYPGLTVAGGFEPLSDCPIARSGRAFASRSSFSLTHKGGPLRQAIFAL